MRFRSIHACMMSQNKQKKDDIKLRNNIWSWEIYSEASLVLLYLMIICHCSRGRIHMQTSLHQHRLSVQLCKRLQVGRDTPPRMILPLAPQVVREEFLNLKYPRISIGVPILIVNSKDFKGEEKK
jgi:hypothetical protein